MDTVLLLLFVSGMSLIAAVFVVSSRSQKSANRRSPRKSSPKGTGARNKQKQKTTKQRKSRYNLDNDDLFEVIFDTIRDDGNKRR